MSPIPISSLIYHNDQRCVSHWSGRLQQDVTSIPLSTLTGSSSLLLSIPDSPHITLPLRPGDYNVDGYPDLVLTLVNSTARGGTFGSKQGTQARVLENVACSTGVPGCANGEERSFWMGQGKGWEALDRMTDVGGASWIDIDDDVSCECWNMS